MIINKPYHTQYTVSWHLSHVSFLPQMATVVSRRVWEERQTSFLDNITAKVDEEQRRKERRIEAVDRVEKV